MGKWGRPGIYKQYYPMGKKKKSKSFLILHKEKRKGQMWY